MSTYTAYMVPKGDGSHTSTYGMGYIEYSVRTSDTSGLWSRVDELAAALNYYDGAYAHSKADTPNYNPFTMEFTWEAPPASVAISNLALKGYVRTSQQGPSSFAYAPKVNGFVDPNGTDYLYTGGAGYIEVTNNLNRNTGSFSGTIGDVREFGTWSVNPATSSAWTISDLTEGTFKAGIKHNTSQGGVPYSPGANAAGLDLLALWIELEVTPIDGNTDIVRGIFSRLLRRQSRPARFVEVVVGPRYEDLDVLDPVWVQHDLMPTADGDGSGVKDWDRTALYVVSKEVDPGSKSVKLVCEDPRDYACTFWSTFRTDLGATSDNNGVPRVDMGSGYSFDRAQVGYRHRPNDFLLVDAASDKMRITPWGLAICGGYSSANSGALEWFTNYNTFAGGSGSTFTGWSNNVSGSGTVTLSPSYRFDVEGLRRGPRLTETSPYTSNYAYLAKTVSGFAASERLRLHLKFSPISGSNVGYLRFLLRRSVDSYCWNPGVGWNSNSSLWVSVAAGALYGGNDGYPSLFRCDGSGADLTSGQWEYWSDEIDLGTSATDVTLGVGYAYDPAGSVYDIQMAALCGTGTASGSKKRVIRRSALVNPDSNQLTQVGDEMVIKNPSGEVWGTQGTCTFIFTPMWAHDDIDTGSGADKYLMYPRADELGGDFNESDFHYLVYRSDSGTAGHFYFVRVYSGSQSGSGASFATSGATLPRYLTPITISVRWTDASGALGLVRKLDIFIDGVKGTTGTAAADVRFNADSWIRVGSQGTSAPEKYADGYFADMEIRSECLSDEAIVRLHNSIGKNMSLPSSYFIPD